MRLFIIVSLLIVLSPLCRAAVTVNIVLSELPPYVDKSAPHYGVIPQLISAALSEQGYRVAYHFVPWSAHYDKAQTNEFDASAVWFCSKERQAMFYCSDPVIREKSVLFFNPQKAVVKWHSLHQLSKLRVGYMDKYHYNHDFRLMAHSGVLDAHRGQAETQLFNDLLQDQLDVVALPLLKGSWVIKNHFGSQKTLFSYTKNALFEANYSVLFLKRRKASRKLRIAFNKGLSAIKKSGQYQSILQQYQIPTD